MLNEKIGNEKQSLAYMSSNLTEYNRMYKEFNQIYHEMAQKMGISQSYISRLEKRIMLRLKKEFLRQTSCA